MGFVDRYRNRHQTGGLQHLLAKQIKQEVGDSRFGAYFKFAVVRNPFDRAVSQFRYMQRRPDLRAFVGMDDDASFTDYLGLVQEKRHVQWEPQCSFLYDEDRTPLVDFVGRFEALDADMAEVFARLGIACDVLPHSNSSERTGYRDYYGPGTRVEVEEMYEDDLDRLGYAF
jgi:hypothetical protein